MSASDSRALQRKVYEINARVSLDMIELLDAEQAIRARSAQREAEIAQGASRRLQGKIAGHRTARFLARKQAQRRKSTSTR